jgi:hypothetical protein
MADGFLESSTFSSESDSTVMSGLAKSTVSVLSEVSLVHALMYRIILDLILASVSSDDIVIPVLDNRSGFHDRFT